MIALDQAGTHDQRSGHGSELRRQAPAARIGLFARIERYWTSDVHRHLAVADRVLLDAAVIHVPASAFNAEWVDACHACGASAYAANADSVDDIRRVADDGADQLSTRDPGLAVATLRAPTP